MPYKTYFGIQGNFFLPKDFFIVDTTTAVTQKAKIEEIEKLGLDMTLRQKQELDQLKKEPILSKNPYGFDVLLLHSLHELSGKQHLFHQLLRDHTIIYNIERNTGTIFLVGDDEVEIHFACFGDIFTPVDMPFSITDDVEQLGFIEDIIKKCQLTVTVLDRGDEEHGYYEDGCNRTLEHQVYEKGVFVKEIKERP